MTGVGWLIALCGPLVVVVSTFLIAMGGFLDEPRAFNLCAALLALQLLAGGAVAVLYRWCFERAAVRGAALLAALVVSLLALSDPVMLGALMGDSLEHATGVTEFTRRIGSMMLQGATLLALTSVVVMILVALFELPLRWLAADQGRVPDGTFRAVRALSLLVIFAAASGVVQGEGVGWFVRLVTRSLGGR
jgi:hypothetical protein